MPLVMKRAVIVFVIFRKNKKSISSSRIGGTKKVSEPSCFDKR